MSTHSEAPADGTAPIWDIPFFWKKKKKQESSQRHVMSPKASARAKFIPYPIGPNQLHDNGKVFSSKMEGAPQGNGSG